MVITPLEDEALHGPLQGHIFPPRKAISVCRFTSISLPIFLGISAIFPPQSRVLRSCKASSSTTTVTATHAEAFVQPTLTENRSNVLASRLSKPSRGPIGSERRGVTEVRGEVTQRACRPGLSAENFTPGYAENPIYLPLLGINADITPTTRQKK